MRCALPLVLPLLAGSSLLAPLSAQVVINEIVYDSPGLASMEFVELSGPPGLSLLGYELHGIDGSDGSTYRSFAIGDETIPPDGYFVVANHPAVPNADLVVPGDWQNGPDEVELRLGFGVVDGVCYGVSLALTCEGTAAEDVGADVALARCPDGSDTNDNQADFLADATPTPGFPNDGDCAENQPTDVSVCQLRQNDFVGTPILIGERVRIRNVVALVSTGVFRGSGAGMEIAVVEIGPERTSRQGACCVAVVDAAFDDLATPVTEGDQISEIIGTVSQTDGVTEITAIELLVVSNAGVVPNPVEVTTATLAASGESLESCFVKICGVSTTSGGWPDQGQDVDVEIDDGSGPTTLRADADTDVDGSAAPSEPFTVLGIVGQADAAAPFADGYFVRPRRRADVLDGIGCPVPVRASTWGAIKARYR